MAESRGSLLAKSVQKHAGRAKEKILQNLGKVDRTADEIFDEHLQNFTRQQNAANRIQKEFSNYIRCIRAAQAASKSLLEAIGETYESQWTGHDLLYVQTQSIDMLWQDFSHKLADQVLLPLNTYVSQFPEMRKKIDKRGRKLVDYDSQRHSFQALQTNMKKRDEAKITKGREQLEEAKRTYEMLNSELHDELPALYDSRILFLVTNLQSLFNAEHVFHSETSKVYGELEAIVDKLATDSQRASYSIKKTNGSSLPRVTNNKTPSPLIINNVSTLNSSHPAEDTPITTTTINTNQSPNNIKESPKIDKIQSQPIYANNDITSDSPPLYPTENDLQKSINDTITTPPTTTTTTTTSITSTTTPTTTTTSTMSPIKLPEINGATTPDGINKQIPIQTPPQSPNSNDENNIINNVQKNNKNLEELYDIPVGANTDNLPPGVLYRVKATYKYVREDVDELSFEVGEIMQVVEYDDPEEQEEGWLMGIKESTGEKGMFPANFTRPL